MSVCVSANVHNHLDFWCLHLILAFLNMNIWLNVGKSASKHLFGGSHSFRLCRPLRYVIIGFVYKCAVELIHVHVYMPCE